ncbi:MAG: hypothetical protein NWE96_00315 [Candidatus Bathyarchaeota archaeon]|nr:hypothetical protein [Candidatus Bathyarchaeota archaeon]
MSENKPLRCQKCGKPLGYVTITARSLLEAKPDLGNVRLVGTCMGCRNGGRFAPRSL